MKKKRIDQLFQEKFLDFEETPSQGVWLAIEASLENKRKKPVLALWFAAAGIAAVVLISFVVLQPVHTTLETHPAVVNTSNAKTIPVSPKEPLISHKPSNLQTSTRGTAPNNATGSAVPGQQQPSQYNQHSTLPKVSQGAIAKGTPKKQPTVPPKSMQNPAITGVARTRTTRTGTRSLHPLLTNTTYGNSKDSTFSLAHAANTQNTVPTRTEPVNAPAHNGLFYGAPLLVQEIHKTGVSGSNQGAKKSILDAIATIEDAKKESSETNKWSAGPSVAPVYFNSLGDGSPIGAIFKENSKSGNVTMSYGLAVDYQVSKRLRVRSGVHKVDYGYDTHDISFSSSGTAFASQTQINSISYSPNASNIIVSSNLVPQEFAKGTTGAELTAKSVKRDGIMSQQLGYLEIPLELNYALLNTKFGLDVMGGFSSLFLVNNALSLQSGNLSTTLGEANNLNKLNFSANIGVGMHYKLGAKAALHLAPVFKYQLNTFSNVTGNFSPYALGMYSGINYKF